METWAHKNWGGDTQGLSRPSKDHTVPEGHIPPLLASQGHS